MQPDRGFRSDIQGLRAIAVCSVVLFHALGSTLSGGFVGVDIFFVISGYLISGLIFKRIAAGEFSIRDFYQRRIKRIFPALYFMLAGTAVVGLFILSPKDYLEFAKTAASTVLFVSNMEFIRLGGYFDGPADLKPLLHTWSLAVEEQFYLFYPLLVTGLWRFGRRHVGIALYALGVLSLVLSYWEIGRSPVSDYFLAPTRFYELIIGGLCAYHRAGAGLSRVASEAMAAAGLACMVGAIVAFDSTMPFPGAIALLPCVGAALVIVAGQGRVTFFGRLSAIPMIAYLGEISFSLYLWHWPVLAFQRQLLMGPRTAIDAAAAIVLAGLLAAFSLRFVERPILHSTVKRSYIKPGLLAMALGGVLAGCAVGSKGLPERFPLKTRQLFSSASDINLKRDVCHGESVAIPYERNCVWGGSTPRVAVWGDSHGAELSVALGSRAAQEGFGVMEITSSACPPSLALDRPDESRCLLHNRNTMSALVGDTRIDKVVLVADYSDYTERGLDRIVDGILRSASGLRQAGKSVTIVLPIPVFQFDPPTLLGLAQAYGRPLEQVGGPTSAYEAATTGVRDKLKRFAVLQQAEIVDPFPLLCDASLCHVFKAGTGALYFNANHLGVTGAGLVARQIDIDLRRDSPSSPGG